MSVSRMMRNRCAPFTSVPGNSSWMLRSITSSRNANVIPGLRLIVSGSGMNRGSMSGTLTRANLVRPPCFTTTARFLLRFEM